MTKIINNCFGLDLTQHKPLGAIAEDDQIIEFKTLADTPPAALLPLIPGESVIAGAAAHNHRRGTGLPWPPECQVPVYNDYQNGTGRIPLICAWQKLAIRSAKSFSGILGDTTIGWRPTGKKELSFPAEKLIAESVTAWKKNYTHSRPVIIIPDSLGEAAQQALIDQCDAFLTPRPVAVALSWCRQYVNEFDGQGEDSEEGVSIGYLMVITMAFDQWEVVPIEIKAKIFNKKLWLVPVRNRSTIGGEFSRIGASFFLGITHPMIKKIETTWHDIFGSSKDLSHAIDKIIPDTEQSKALRDCIIRGWSERDQLNFQALSAWRDIVSGAPHIAPNSFKDDLISLRNKQLEFLPEKARGECLGIIIDGACAHIHITETRRLGDFVADAFNSSEVIISDGYEAVRGAAYTAAALDKGLPCYRETILPIEIHHHRKDRHGDWTNAYKLLVEGTTVRAGQEYRSKKPVTGLKIKQGEKTLNLILRRSTSVQENVFRKVSAEIPKETQKEESVLISAYLQPGQGFAKVTINSARKGVFSTLLDWRTMEDCEEPPPPNLSYLPQVSKVQHNRTLWHDAERFLKAAINALENDNYDLIENLDSLRNHINKWPLADHVDNYRGRIPKDDPFLHYGVFPSDGDISTVTSPDLAKQFIEACDDYYATTRDDRKKEKIQWAASWLYLSCPSAILKSSRRNLNNSGPKTRPVDLHTIGLCWDKKNDLADFFEALEQVFLAGNTAINNWLRASRNIVRFRDHALKPEVVPDERLDNIINGIFKALSREICTSNFARKFDNCILSLLYLLKRRRYDPNFLAPENDLTIEIDKALNGLITERRRQLSTRQYTIVSITIKFFRKEASYDDLQGIMIEE